MKLSDLNLWWSNGKIPIEYSSNVEKELFIELNKYLKNRQILAVTGLRRTGKTYLLYQLIEELLKTVDRTNILYFSFDMEIKSIEKLLNEYSEVTNVDFKKDKIFVFLDEVQKMSNWENEIKLLYDNYPNIKFIISGSASLIIEKKKGESLAGRIYSFISNVLSFKEYLRIKKIDIDFSKPLVYDSLLEKEFKKYLLSGGFPELVFETETFKISKYIKETVLDRVLYSDIPSCFKIDEPELLSKLFSIISSNPGIIIDYSNLANDLKRDRKTISKYLDFLEKAYLIKKVYNFSNNLLTSEKKSKKFYPVSTAFGYFYNSEEGKILEGYVANFFDFKYFLRNLSKEVDFVKDKTLIEVKYKNEIKSNEFLFIDSLLEKKEFKDSLVVNKDIRRRVGGKIFFPAKYLGLLPIGLKSLDEN